MKDINYKGTDILNVTGRKANLERQDLVAAFYLAWKLKNPVVYKILKDAVDDDAVLKLIDEYTTYQLNKADTLTSTDKVTSKVFAHLDLFNVLMDKNNTGEDKHAALANWETTMLEIVGNISAEVLNIGRVVGETKTLINENPKIKAYKERETILKEGRAIGSKSQKKHAADTKKLIEKINSDLLRHSITARWTLNQRAERIEQTLNNTNRKQINGKPYRLSTIKLFITGKG